MIHFQLHLGDGALVQPIFTKFKRKRKEKEKKSGGAEKFSALEVMIKNMSLQEKLCVSHIS